jgi:hypothetical protein
VLAIASAEAWGLMREALDKLVAVSTASISGACDATTARR